MNVKLEEESLSPYLISCLCIATTIYLCHKEYFLLLTV